ncbi:hypothetical protein J3A83DRAFT_4192949 [Scleroderma citrinum]
MPQKHKVANKDANGIYLNENATVQWSSHSGRGTGDQITQMQRIECVQTAAVLRSKQLTNLNTETQGEEINPMAPLHNSEPLHTQGMGNLFSAQDLLYLVLPPYNSHSQPNQPSVWYSLVIGSDLGYQALVKLEARLGPVVMNHWICSNLHPMLALTSLVVLPALPQLLPLMHHHFAHHSKEISGQASKLMAKVILPTSECWHWPLSLELRLLFTYPFSKLDGPTSPPHSDGSEPDENDPEVNMNNDEPVDKTSLSDEDDKRW